MKQCSLPLVFFICPDPQPFIPPPICPLPLSSHLSFLGLSDCSCYRWGEHGGFVSVRMCLTTRRRSWKMRQMVAIYQHLSGAWRRSGRGRWGGAESDTEGFSLWGWPWWNGCGFSSAASNRQGGGWIKREKEREKGRGKGLSSVCRLPLPHQAAAFLPQQFPLHHLHHPPPPPLIPGSKPLKVCSATVQCALFPLFFPPSFAICISVGVETDDRTPMETGNEQGEKLFHSPVMPCQLSLPPRALQQLSNHLLINLPPSLCAVFPVNQHADKHKPLEPALIFLTFFAIYLLPHRPIISSPNSPLQCVNT